MSVKDLDVLSTDVIRYSEGIFMRSMVLVLILFPGVVLAQTYSGIDKEKMQKAMTCIQSIDKSGMEALTAKGKRMQVEVGALCQDGNRDAAQEKAMAYAEEMLARPEIQQMQECSKFAEGLLEKMPYEQFEDIGQERHICDEPFSE